MGKKVKKEATPPPKDVFDSLTIESKKTGTVVLMLKSDEEEVLTKACEAVYKFADKCDENKLMLLELGAIDPIINLITHEDRVVRRYAVMSFGVLAGHAEVRQYLRKTKSIEGAVQLLGDEDDVCNEFASLFLAHMSNEYISKLAIYKNEGLEPLINLLESPDPDVQKNSAQAICNLVQDFQIRAAIRDLGGIPPLLEFLKSEYAIIQELALTTLAAVTQDADTRVVLRENEGLEKLIEFLNHKEFEDLHVHGLQVLGNCLEDTEALDEFRNSGGMEKLLLFTTESAAPEVQAFSARAMARAAKNVENAKILHEQEVEKTLITLSGSDNDTVKIAACQAICTLSDNLAARDTFGKSEGIPPLINLLQSESADVKEAATLALANLTLNHKNNCMEIISSGGIEILIGLLNFNKEAVVVNSLTCLINMSHDEQLRTDIQKRGLIASLTEPLKSDSIKIQSKAAQAIASFVTGSESRAELRKYGGLEPLVRHLRSGDAQLRRDASWAILSSCVDTPTATAISNLGALEILQQINSSEQRRNNFSLAALDKLLDSNLPAKYSLTGKLSSHNIISDGFYDAGMLRPDAKFLPLEEIAKEELNQRRPILLVNCKPPEPKTSEEEDMDSLSERSEILLYEVGGIPPIEVHSPSGQEQRKASLPSPLNSPRNESLASLKPTQDESSEKRVSSKASLTRRMKKKDKEAQAREEAERLAAEKQDNVYRPPVDTALQGYIDDVNKFIAPMPTMREQIVALAQYVVEKMGGEVEKGKMMDFSWELHISELKFDSKSNIISIGKINKGIFYHRALLFKVLADRIAVPCSLVQGEYNRAWNEVMVSSEEVGTNFPPFKYIVDLMHEAGRLIRADSPAAVRYQSL
uniref:armadillo repeat-containing protein 3-like isoform X1 n=1 Tax=Styela clava TaxID=7725 RepID=UPI00193AD2A8|nr:armadillo repeat-containing protein 3-like isoform X1 [Styela clava]